MANSTQKISLTRPVDIEVTRISKNLPAASLAFAFAHRKGIYRAVVVDMATWGVHAVVEGSRTELTDRFAREDGAAGILFMHGPGPVSDIVVPVGGGRPPGGGGPHGWPGPLVLAVVEAVSRIVKVKARSAGRARRRGSAAG